MDLKFPKLNNPIEDKALTLARESLKKIDMEREMRKQRRLRCHKCFELFQKDELINGYCPKCRNETNQETPKKIKEFKGINDLIPMPEPVKTKYIKECFACDGKVFYFLGAGKIKCVRCGAEYDVIRRDNNETKIL